MTIDPIAAVTTATDGVQRPAAGADPATSASSPDVNQNGSDVRAIQGGGQDGAKVDLFDYSAKLQNRPPAIDTLQPEGKAKYLANPAALGEQVLQRMESLHQRSLDYRNELDRAGTSPIAAGGGDQVMAGPATQHVAGTAGASKSNGLSHLTLMFDYALETTMISSSSSQFVSAVNTLMRGQ